MKISKLFYTSYIAIEEILLFMFDNIIAFFQKHYVLFLSVTYNILLSIGILIISVLIARAIKKGILKGHTKLKKVDQTLIPIITTTAGYIVYLIGTILILDIFGVNTTSIIALLGAAGLAVGFALKDTLSNIAAGIMLLFIRPFRAGDYIEFGTIAGKVKEINLFNTVLETNHGIFISSPNNIIWANNIANFTRNKKRRIDINIGISYKDDINKGLEVLQSIIDKEPRILKTPPPKTLVYAFNESSVDLQLRVWVPTHEYWDIHWDLKKLVKEEIERAGLTIPFPHRTLEITSKTF